MHVQRQIDQLLAQRAAEWVDTLKAGDREDHAAFLEWMRQSTLHVEHYLESEALDRQIQALGRTRGPDLDVLLARIAPDVRPLKREIVVVDGRKPRWHRSWPIAAALAVVSIGALALFGLRYIASSANRVATAVGEQRNVTLPDGSRMFVNALSHLRIDYTAHRRDIELISGEAVFQVARDPARPFVVHTKTASVRALGTQFNVYQRRDDTALVSVIEGRVQITRLALARGAAPPKKSDVENLSAGEEAKVTRRRIERRAHPDVAKTVGWREGRLFFDETPLAEMVHEFNRYGGPLQLKLEGGGFERYRFGGVFNANEPDVLVEILERQKDLSVERQPDGVIVIRALRLQGEAKNSS
jgi:transmembrane sensor